MKHIFIVNPIAGRNDVSQRVKNEALRLLPQERCSFLRTEYAGHAAALAADAAKEAAGAPARIYSCGGDGTLNEVLCGIDGKAGCELAVYPCGTGNDFVRTFVQDARELFSLERLIQGEARPVDIMRVNGRPCLNIASVGLDSATAANVHRFSGIPLLGHRAYQLSLLFCFFAHMRNRYEISIDGGPAETGDYIIAAAANGRCYGGGFQAAPEAVLDDGAIDCVTVRSISRLRVAGLLGAYKNGRHVKNGESLYPNIIAFRRASRIEIRADRPLPVNVDGEILSMRNPVIELVPRALQLVLPAGAAQSGAVTAGQAPLCACAGEYSACGGR